MLHHQSIWEKNSCWTKVYSILCQFFMENCTTTKGSLSPRKRDSLSLFLFLGKEMMLSWFHITKYSRSKLPEELVFKKVQFALLPRTIPSKPKWVEVLLDTAPERRPPMVITSTPQVPKCDWFIKLRRLIDKAMLNRVILWFLTASIVAKNKAWITFFLRS